MQLKRLLPFVFGALGVMVGLSAAETPAETPSAGANVPAQRSKWNGFDRIDFTFEGRPAILVEPAEAAPGRPWIWRTEFFGHEPQVDLALLARGWHVAYLNAKDMYGGPKAMRLFGQFYAHLVVQASLAPRVVLEGFSRGGLYAFNFAASHPTRVAALYLDAPVLDIRSWPGRNRASKEWAQCLEAYGLTEESLATFRGNPIDRVVPVAKAGVPVIAVDMPSGMIADGRPRVQSGRADFSLPRFARPERPTNTAPARSRVGSARGVLCSGVGNSLGTAYGTCRAESLHRWVPPTRLPPIP